MIPHIIGFFASGGRFGSARHVHPGTRQEFAKLASVTPSDVEEYDERSRELMEKATAVKIFWNAMSQSDGV